MRVLFTPSLLTSLHACVSLPLWSGLQFQVRFSDDGEVFFFLLSFVALYSPCWLACALCLSTHLAIPPWVVRVHDDGRVVKRGAQRSSIAAMRRAFYPLLDTVEGFLPHFCQYCTFHPKNAASHMRIPFLCRARVRVPFLRPSVSVGCCNLCRENRAENPCSGGPLHSLYSAHQHTPPNCVCWCVECEHRHHHHHRASEQIGKRILDRSCLQHKLHNATAHTQTLLLLAFPPSSRWCALFVPWCSGGGGGVWISSERWSRACSGKISRGRSYTHSGWRKVDAARILLRISTPLKAGGFRSTVCVCVWVSWVNDVGWLCVVHIHKGVPFFDSLLLKITGVRLGLIFPSIVLMSFCTHVCVCI